MRSKIDAFVERLIKLNIEVELHGNYPWIYLYSVNGNKVSEKFQANHGFTAFIMTADNAKITSIPELFKIVRKYR